MLDTAENRRLVALPRAEAAAALGIHPQTVTTLRRKWGVVVEAVEHERVVLHLPPAIIARWRATAAAKRITLSEAARRSLEQEA